MPDVNRDAPESTHVQSVVFKKEEWTKEESQKWVEEHDFFSDGYDENETQHRWRQYQPDEAKYRYRAQKIQSGDGRDIILVVGFLRNKKQGESNMKRIEIRGVIVPADYDVEMFQNYVTLGVITPESVIRKKIQQHNEDLEIYIHSPGGSVWAAYEIINALTDWKMQTGNKIVVTLGGLVASAGASIAYMIPADEINAHRNTKVMFHGAWTETIGGKEIHEETAKLLNSINADVQKSLLMRSHVAPEEIQKWFEDGNEKWLTSAELASMNLIDSIIDEEIFEQICNVDFAAMGERGLAIAAFYSQEPQEKKETMSEEWKRGYEMGKNEMTNELIEQLEKVKNQNSKLENLIKKLQSEKDKLVAQYEKKINELTAELNCSISQNTELSERLRKLALQALRPSPQVNTWAEALRACNGDYAKARRQYPHIFQQIFTKARKEE